MKGISEMSRKLIGIAIAAIMTTSSARAEDIQLTPFTAIGPGVTTCASWRSTPNYHALGVGWIAGYFTGINSTGTFRVGRNIGAGTDLAVITAEVDKACDEEPSMRLI